MWSTIIDATTIIIQAYTYTNHANFIRQNEKYDTMALQKNQILIQFKMKTKNLTQCYRSPQINRIPLSYFQDYR